MRKQLLDVVIPREDTPRFAGRLPDGLDDRAAHNLITFKAQRFLLASRSALRDHLQHLIEALARRLGR